MEKGFFHPEVGYWQTVSDPSEEVLSKYPEGTIEVPLKPGANFEWDKGAWVETEALNPPYQGALSFSQFLIGLVTEQWITEADGNGWLVGVLPPSVEATINLGPADQRFAARARATRPSEVLRLDPLVQMMSMAQGRSPEEVDDFFVKYATV
jgi:hypothetical protein